MHLRGVATPMISANKPYHHHHHIYMYIVNNITIMSTVTNNIVSYSIFHL